MSSSHVMIYVMICLRRDVEEQKTKTPHQVANGVLAKPDRALLNKRLFGNVIR
jgi:hypothetical protein